MVVVANKRSVMTLYSGAADLYSHQVRIVLTEKQVAVDIIETDLEIGLSIYCKSIPMGLFLPW
jgi:RNA polymerase-associated protein